MKIIDSITLGATIRARRKELGYTQSDLAEFTGFSISFISDLERGKKTAEIGKALQLIQLLGMDIKIEKRGSDEFEKMSVVFIHYFRKKWLTNITRDFD